MSDAELYALSSEIDAYNPDVDLFDGCDAVADELYGEDE
jgi:hypothetical protein